MLKNRLLVLSAAGLFLSSCTGVMTKNQAAMVGAATCGTIGGLGGAATRANQDAGREVDLGSQPQSAQLPRRFGLRRACVAIDGRPKTATTTTATATTATAATTTAATTAGTETATATATTASSTTGAEGRADDNPR